jgi:tetrahydromethanopterin S-methyltransferase subunit G
VEEVMEQRLDKLDEKLDRVAELQAEMVGSLKEHIRRTEIAEDNIEKIANALQPIQEHVAFIRGLGKLGTGLLALLTAIATVWQIVTGGK